MDLALGFWFVRSERILGYRLALDVGPRITRKFSVRFSETNRGPVEATPPGKLIDPDIEGIWYSCRRADDGSGAMREQGSRVPAAAL